MKYLDGRRVGEGQAWTRTLGVLTDCVRRRCRRKEIANANREETTKTRWFCDLDYGNGVSTAEFGKKKPDQFVDNSE